MQICFHVSVLSDSLFTLTANISVFFIPYTLQQRLQFYAFEGNYRLFLLCFVAPNLTNITRLISANQCGSGTADEARLNADREGDWSGGEKARYVCGGTLSTQNVDI